MSIYYLFVFFICLNISGYFLIKHFGGRREESGLFIGIAILSCIFWIAAIALTTYIYFASGNKLLIYSWSASVILGFISTLTILIIKLINYYRK